MGNTLISRSGCSSYNPTINKTNGNKSIWKWNDKYETGDSEMKSKTLPIRNATSNNESGITNIDAKTNRQSNMPSITATVDAAATAPATTTTTTTTTNSGETSRLLFLLYLIHRTWNVLTDNKSKSSHTQSQAKTVNDSAFFESGSSLNTTDLNGAMDDDLSQCCSQYSLCSCSSCYQEIQQHKQHFHDDQLIQSNLYNSIDEYFSQDSIKDFVQETFSNSDSSLFSLSYQMAPSVCQNPSNLISHNNNNNNNNTKKDTNGSTSSITKNSNYTGNSINGSMVSYKMSSSENSWFQNTFSKENQRPPVYNPEDYAQSLKKFGKRQNGKNLYEYSDLKKPDDTVKSATLPYKLSEYKSPIITPPFTESEMSLRQFSSITDLLTKLRADLRVSFPSFVQEFVASPSNGVSLLLEVLRSIQLSQAINAPVSTTSTVGGTIPRHTQNYQKRALLDELACLQCLSICCSRSLEATASLGSTQVGLMPLASSATGQGIRARILALQLMAAACDRSAFGHGNQKLAQAGHTAVSEAMSTLRLRCSEPVRFRLLVGMLNSGGGSGELQAVGVKFINSFLESSENLQQRLYLQAELFQAGFDPHTMCKTISASSPWLDALRNELKRFQDIYVDVDKMIAQSREAERVRSQMVILERRVQILHEEKAVLTSMERRLQERCAELQREIFRLQGAQNESSFKSLDKQPITLPRHIPPAKQKTPEGEDILEHEDEGISSSDTGPSLSPVPILVLPQMSSKPVKSITNDTIEAAMKELDNVVSEAEKQFTSTEILLIRNNVNNESKEKDIIPVNIVPQPPRKSRSLAHLVIHDSNSELDGSDYGMLLLQKQVETRQDERVNVLRTFFDETDYELQEISKTFQRPRLDSPQLIDTDIIKAPAIINQSNTRELLDVIMNARQTEDDPTIKALREVNNNINNKGKIADTNAPQITNKQQLPAQHFNGVFFMTGMNTPQKYPKPDLTAALQARRVTKTVERLEAVFANHNETFRHDTNNINQRTNNKERSNSLLHSREKSQSNQQIYFGSNPALRNSNSRPDLLNQTTTTATTSRTRSYTQGSKVTDIPSGLY